MPADLLIIGLLAAALYLGYKSETARARQIERRRGQRLEQICAPGPDEPRDAANV